MTRKELAHELHISENTLKASFNRTQEIYERKGIYVHKIGRGEKAEYEIIYEEDL